MSLLNYLKVALILSLVELALASSKTRQIALGKAPAKKLPDDHLLSPAMRGSPDRENQSV